MFGFQEKSAKLNGQSGRPKESDIFLSSFKAIFGTLIKIADKIKIET
jgi:hypothetical protein